ncbi:hypothetical protein [Plasmodium yoelii yoelii]|uniref:Uncharacterized protein n=1 Tax=Plasmodium yoelii yoelii TaxID=73239 RepID=Q7RGW2_PLAYO|nr:hypothetical protein [Plasmodium yoelii yoelii]
MLSSPFHINDNAPLGVHIFNFISKLNIRDDTYIKLVFNPNPNTSSINITLTQ